MAGDLAELASDLGDAAAEQKTGVAIFVDELQDADPEVLRGLCAAVHAAAQTSLPFYLIGAGLPSLPGILSNAVTYAERLFEYRPIEHLGEHDSAEVLALPAAQEGVSWDDDAIAIIAGEAGGYPYFLPGVRPSSMGRRCRSRPDHAQRCLGRCDRGSGRARCWILPFSLGPRDAG